VDIELLALVVEEQTCENDRNRRLFKLPLQRTDEMWEFCKLSIQLHVKGLADRSHGTWRDGGEAMGNQRNYRWAFRGAQFNHPQRKGHIDVLFRFGGLYLSAVPFTGAWYNESGPMISGSPQDRMLPRRNGRQMWPIMRMD